MSMSIAVPSMSLLSSLVNLHSPRKHKHKRSRSMPSRLQGCPILTSFQNQLAGEVKRLEQQAECSSSSCFGADWLGQALQVVVNANSNLSQIDIDTEGMGCKWMNQHLDDMVHLLEVCNLLRDSISEITKQHMCVQVAIRGLGINPNAHALERARNSLACWLGKKEIQSRLEKCMSILRRMADKLNLEEKAGAGLEAPAIAIDINHTKAITILVCYALVTALSFKTPRLKIQALPLPRSFTSLQDKLKEAFGLKRRSSSSSSRFLHELEEVDIALGNLNNVLNSNSKLLIPLQLSPTTMALHDLEMALPSFEHKINQLFKLLITSRVALLNTISSQ
ncbi:hypothetical protein KI387_035846 [Taxus chinensis]|uniref:Uncharacterized protein n=1 Tax=Taxus chinensis TaxID=29808 RepID=A0AA38FPT2_TAXCH|nr:hypothetical protein KI387_035846 [Taxus chinensis]